jgi:hypothetical protein
LCKFKKINKKKVVMIRALNWIQKKLKTKTIYVK